MKPLLVLVTTFLLSCATLKVIITDIDYQLAGRIAMACMLVFTAIAHFVFTKGMVEMIPDILPFKNQIILATGILELIFAIGLLFPNYKFIAGWMLIVFFILILPANIKATMEHIDYQTGEQKGPGLHYLWLRIPMQLFFITWVYLSAIKF